MSFSLEIKQELLDGRLTRRRAVEAQACGFFLFARRCEADAVCLTTENAGMARLFERHARLLLSGSVAVSCERHVLPDRESYLLSLPEAGDRVRLMERLGDPAHIDQARLVGAEPGAFLSGVYLSCGSITDPEKGYHLEFIARRESLCRELATLLEQYIPGVKTTARRGVFVAYYKDRTQIEDLLTLMGASKASLTMIDVEMIKEVRNRANRVTNCETANIDKTVSAAAGQMQDIAYILAAKGLEFLPENLRGVALLRLENPDLSLRELCALCEESISRSGLHHRLEKLSKIAAELRGGKSL
jgi:DNA-binding protein WhiA